MATTSINTETYTEKTAGRSGGPLTTATGVGSMLLVVLTFVATSFGLAVPEPVLSAIVGLILTGVVWFARGRKEVEVIQLPPEPVEDGTGAHRATDEVMPEVEAAVVIPDADAETSESASSLGVWATPESTTESTGSTKAPEGDVFDRLNRAAS